MNTVNIISPKDLCIALCETIKRKPIKSLMLIVATVATLALSIILAVLLGPLAPLPFVIAITAVSLLNPSLISFLFFQDIKESLFNQFKRNHTIDKLAKSDVVLILEAQDDHNGAFQQDQRNLFNQIQKNMLLPMKKYLILNILLKALIACFRITIRSRLFGSELTATRKEFA